MFKTVRVTSDKYYAFKAYGLDYAHLKDGFAIVVKEGFNV